MCVTVADRCVWCRQVHCRTNYCCPCLSCSPWRVLLLSACWRLWLCVSGVQCQWCVSQLSQLVINLLVLMLSQFVINLFSVLLHYGLDPIVITVHAVVQHCINSNISFL